MASLDLLGLLEGVRRHWLRLAALCLLGGAVGYGVAWIIPPTYRAQASILPPEEDEMTSSLQMARKGLPGLGGLGRLSAYFTQADIAQAVLRSRTITEAIIDSLGLEQRFKTRRRDDSVLKLRDIVDIRMAADGTISVAVEHKDPRLAADIANRYFDELDRFNKANRSYRARRSRQFLERRVAETDSALGSAEARLADYQKRRGAIVIPPDARGAAESAGGLMAQKAQAEVELELVRRYASSRSQEVGRLEARVRELGRLLGSLPATQVGAASAVRDVYTLQQLNAFLSAQLEEARLQEAMDAPTISILDRAPVPDRPRWPRKSWVALFGACLGLLGGVLDLRFGRRGRPATG